MYHLELRQFPHNLCRFNLSAQQLREVVEPWAAEKWVDIGERKWSPHQAKLTVLEGPELHVSKLAMGRGWRAAQRESTDVTERVLEAAKVVVEQAALQALLAAQSKAAEGAQAQGGDTAPADVSSPPLAAAAAAAERAAPAPAADPLALGVQLASLLGPDAGALLEAWRTAAAASNGLSPSETLALAETRLRKLHSDTG